MRNMNDLCMGCMSDNHGNSVCPVCGFDAENYKEPNALALRTVLSNRYVVGKVTAAGSEGFTYLGFDTVTETVVKIREYFPTGLCIRLPGGAVEINATTSYVYNEGIIKFIELHKSLGMLADVAAIYPTIDLFETLNTAYCVFEYAPGISLKEFLIRNGGTLTWEQVRPLFLPLITALKALHANGIVHGALSPESLMVGRDGKIRITDFSIPDIRMAQSSMTAQLFPGYAAIEQYEGGNLTAATDVYGFAATMFRALTGNAPADSMQRLEHDSMSFPKSLAEQLPRGVLIAMANALQIKPADRTANMDEFRADLQSEPEPTVGATTKSAVREEKKPASSAGSRKYALMASLATALILALIGGIIYLVAFRGNKPDATSSVSVPSVASVGDIGNPSSKESLYSVPDFSGSTLAALKSNEEYAKWFEFSVVRKEYNSKISRGKVCAQSVAIGTAAKKDTKVELVISLGPEKITIPRKLQGMERTKAYIALLELGFDPVNIEFIEKKDTTPTKEETVISTTPEIGTSVSPDESIIVYYNTNLIPDESSTPSQSVDPFAVTD